MHFLPLFLFVLGSTPMPQRSQSEFEDTENYNGFPTQPPGGGRGHHTSLCELLLTL